MNEEQEKRERRKETAERENLRRLQIEGKNTPYQALSSIRAMKNLARNILRSIDGAHLEDEYYKKCAMRRVFYCYRNVFKMYESQFPEVLEDE
jgi:hypothetical protein